MIHVESSEDYGLERQMQGPLPSFPDTGPFFKTSAPASHKVRRFSLLYPLKAWSEMLAKFYTVFLLTDTLIFTFRDSNNKK